MSVALQVAEPADPTELAVVDQGLSDFNAAVAALAQVRPLAVFARDSQGRVVGGALARTWGECCELRQLWVAEGLRRQGIGRRLVSACEAEARQRGCTLVYLDTFTFQAPDFYARLGYRVALETSGFGPGIRKLTLHKTWPPATAGR